MSSLSFRFSLVLLFLLFVLGFRNQGAVIACALETSTAGRPVRPSYRFAGSVVVDGSPPVPIATAYQPSSLDDYGRADSVTSPVRCRWIG